MRSLLAAALALSVSMSAGLGQEADYAEGREKSEAFLGGDLAAVWEEMTPEMQGAFGTLEGLQTFRAGLESAFGSEADVLEETVQPAEGGLDVYQRTSRWSDSAAPILMQWAINADDKVAGFLVKPLPVLAESRFLDYQTKTPLQLPFAGEWFVVWGGRTLEQNYHAADRAQRFAMDMLIYRDGATHSGDAAVLENYYCWDQPILAPAAGTVIVVVKELPDNAIGQTDTTNVAGNHVVVDFGNGEFGLLGHMRQGSVAVAEGQTIEAGQELGRCGNSGNTSEPHLHMHLQTTAELSTGEGLPAFFADYVADGYPVARGELLGGQQVRGE